MNTKNPTPMSMDPLSPQLQDLMDDENLILGEDLVPSDTRAGEDRECEDLQEGGLMGGEGFEAPM